MIIGVTGRIGSGKTTLSKAIMRDGWGYFDSDTEAKKHTKGRYDASVFANPKAYAQMKKEVWPLVVMAAETWVKSQKGPAILESAMLFESGLTDLCDYIICISASEKVRLNRTKLGGADFMARNRKQLNHFAKADLVLINEEAGDELQMIEKLYYWWKRVDSPPM